MSPEDAGPGCFVAEVVFPGVWIVESDIDDPRRRAGVEGQLMQLASLLDQVAVTLRFFEVVMVTDRERYKKAQQDEENIRRRVSEQLRLSAESRREKALSDTRREAWLGGAEPMSYVHMLPTTFARAFVVALDRFAKTLAVFAEDVKREAVTAAKKRLDDGVPGLRDMRDNVAHVEDRGRGVKRGGKPIELKPVSSSMVRAPAGGVLVIEGLNGDVFCGTGAKGELVEIPIRRESLCLARDCLQEVLNAFSWKGGKRYHPT